jgi:hypothetical protein
MHGILVVYRNNDDLWLEVADYLDQAYALDAVEKIYLSGDGAPWIKNGLNWLKDSIYVLDRYHLSKYVTRATAHMNYMAPIMWEYINRGDYVKATGLAQGEVNYKSVLDQRITIPYIDVYEVQIVDDEAIAINDY